MSQAPRHISQSLRMSGCITRIHFRNLITITTPSGYPFQAPSQHQRARLHPQTRPFTTSPSTSTSFSPPPQSRDWSASQYLKYSNERTRPVFDLLSQVRPYITSPTPRIYDLGCGPGNSTRVLLDAFPSARITGLDSSADMLMKAKAEFEGEENVDFVTGDLATFKLKGAEGGEKVDLLFSNAVFHWLRSPTRLQTLVRLFQSMKKGGVIAIQIPDNYHKASHRAMRSTALVRGKPWSSAFGSSGVGDVEDKERPDLDPIEPSMVWYNRLVPYAENLNIWRTTYYHVLPSHSSIVEWVKGTGLQPFLHRIESSSAKEAFLQEYETRLKEPYPKLSDGNVMLAYPRLFVVAVRK